MPDDQLEMFDMPPVVGHDLSPDARRTAANRALLASGVHPATRLPLLDGWGFECGGCKWAVRVRHHRNTYYKCMRHTLGMSHGAATDIRISWTACTLFTIDPGTTL